MKQIYVLRHSKRADTGDTLTEEGKEYAKQKRRILPNFTVVISSPANRAKQTAQLVSTNEVNYDERAGIPTNLNEYSQEINEISVAHPLGVVGALFIIAQRDSRLVELLQNAGQELLELAQETFEKLGDGEAALIVTHDGTLACLEKYLQNEPFNTLPSHSFQPLGGIILNQDLQISYLD